MNKTSLKAFWVAGYHFSIIYGIALSIWGVVLKKSIFWFSLSGIIIGFLISLFFIMPVITIQKTKEEIKEIMFASGGIFGTIGIIIGILGIVIWIVRIIFF